MQQSAPDMLFFLWPERVLDPTTFEVLFDHLTLKFPDAPPKKVGSNIEPTRHGLFNKKECDLTNKDSWI